MKNRRLYGLSQVVVERREERRLICGRAGGREQNPLLLQPSRKRKQAATARIAQMLHFRAEKLLFASPPPPPSPPALPRASFSLPAAAIAAAAVFPSFPNKSLLLPPSLPPSLVRSDFGRLSFGRFTPMGWTMARRFLKMANRLLWNLVNRYEKDAASISRMMHPFGRCVFDKENFFPNETAAGRGYPCSVSRCCRFTAGNICSIRRKLAKLCE